MATDLFLGQAAVDDADDERGEFDRLEIDEAVDQETEEYYPVEYSISSYGADYPVDGLVKRVTAGSIYVPQFQRGFVWNIFRASRFVKSLLLGLPVPAIFLSRDEATQKLLVIDGQQRLRTLQYFYECVFGPAGVAFRLRGVQKRFEGATYKTLREEDRLRLDDSILHAIIVKQEKPLDEDPSSIYHIFERLNTGGMLLQPQEIRTCIFHGPLSALLAELNGNAKWREVFGKISSRMRDQELILRFFALLNWSESYAKPMKEFLNRFMVKNRFLEVERANEFRRCFDATVTAIRTGFGEKAFKPRRGVNAALCDALLVGVARRLEHGPIMDYAELMNRYSRLLADSAFQAAINSATTDEGSVMARQRMAMAAFSGSP